MYLYLAPESRKRRLNVAWWSRTGACLVHVWKRSLVTALVLVVQAAGCSRWSVRWRRNFAASSQSERAEPVECRVDWMGNASVTPCDRTGHNDETDTVDRFFLHFCITIRNKWHMYLLCITLGYCRDSARRIHKPLSVTWKWKNTAITPFKAIRDHRFRYQRVSHAKLHQTRHVS